MTYTHESTHARHLASKIRKTKGAKVMKFREQASERRKDIA